MTLKELKEQVANLVGAARTKEAIENIINWAKQNNQEQLKNDATLLKSGITKLNREKNLGLLSFSDASIKQAKINNGVLNLLGSVIENNPSQSTTDNDQQTETQSSTEPNKMKILMLTANPANTTKLNLDKEHSDIIQKLQKKQAFFNIILKKAVSGIEFKEFTYQEKPDILHFSGHGEKAGIMVQNDDKNKGELIPISGLKALFKFLKKHCNIKVVLLNACHTQEQAAAISKFVDYVIGTNVAINDTAAIAFSSGFYFYLAEGDKMKIEDAFDSGRTAAIMKGKGAKEQHFVIYRNGELIEIG